MELRHCDICGGWVSGDEEAGRGEVLVCETCLATRRVLPLEADRAAPSLHRQPMMRFTCPNCGRGLKSRPVKRRTEAHCPSCEKRFLLLPGGDVQPLEGPLRPESCPEAEEAILPETAPKGGAAGDIPSEPSPGTTTACGAAVPHAAAVALPGATGSETPPGPLDSGLGGTRVAALFAALVLALAVCLAAIARGGAAGGIATHLRPLGERIERGLRTVAGMTIGN